MEKIESYEKELCRIKQAVRALSEGKPIDGYMEFDANAFPEENEIWSDSFSDLARMTDKLMEIKYCNHYSVCEDLEKECEQYREKVRIHTRWETGK